MCPVIGFAFDPVDDQIPSAVLRSGMIQLGLYERILAPGWGRRWGKGDKKKQDQQSGDGLVQAGLGLEKRKIQSKGGKVDLMECV